MFIQTLIPLSFFSHTGCASFHIQSLLEWQSLCKILSWLIPSSSIYFLLHSYQNWWDMHSWLPSFLQSFLIAFLLKSDEKCSLGSLPSASIHFWPHSYIRAMRNALLAHSLLQYSFLIMLLCSYLKMVRNALLSPFPPPVSISYYILIKKQWEMLSWPPSLLQWSFLITFLFKNDEKCSLGSLPSSSVHFLLLPY